MCVSRMTDVCVGGECTSWREPMGGGGGGGWRRRCGVRDSPGDVDSHNVILVMLGSWYLAECQR